MNANRALSLTLLLGSLLAAAPARAAQPDSAETLFDRGLKAMEAGRFEEACPLVEQSYKLAPLPGALFTLAECEAQRGRSATAVARYDEFLAVYATLPADKKVKQAPREKAARSARAALAPKVAELTLVLPPSAPRGTQVVRDGAPVAEAALGVPLPVDPGEHVLAAKAPDGTVTETRVKLAPGEKKGVALDVRQADATPKQEAASPAAGGVNRSVIVAGGTVAGAGIVAGAVLLGVSAAKGSTVRALQDELKQAGGCASAAASGDCADLRSAGSSKAALGNAGFWALVGGGAIGVGTLVYGLVGGGTRPAKASVRLVPVVIGEGGGLLLQGVF